MPSAPSPNSLFYGDCLDWMRQWPHESVDLIYLDPPFNSNANYNILFGKGNGVSAQMRGFTDTWKWNEAAAERVDRIEKSEATRVQKPVRALKALIGECGMLAYLSYMGERLEVMRNLLKPTGSIYLHCDDTAGAYLRVLMDSVFDAECFRNEVIWRRTRGRSDAIRYGRVHDVILFYTRSPDRFTWNTQWLPHDPEYVKRAYRNEDERGHWRSDQLTASGPSRGESGQPWRGIDPGDVGRHWSTPIKGGMNDWIRERDLIPGWPGDYPSVHQRLDALDAAGLIHWPKRGSMPSLKRYYSSTKGTACDDMIVDIGKLEAADSEKLDYPTQKPVALLERIIRASSNEGDLVLDPFCGCGTAVVAAHNLGRRWLGIDISATAIDIIQSQRLRPLDIKAQAHGIPQDLAGARRLAADQHFKFEEWAVTRIDGLVPNERQVGDSGIDGRGRMLARPDTHDSDLVLAQVTGAQGFSLGKFRDFLHVVERENAAAGVYVTLDRRGTDAALAEARGKGEIIVGASRYPRVQVWSIADYFDGRSPYLPTLADPYTGKAVQPRLG